VTRAIIRLQPTEYPRRYVSHIYEDLIRRSIFRKLKADTNATFWKTTDVGVNE